MTDGGHVPNEGLPEHLLPETGIDPAQGGGGWGSDLLGQAVPPGMPRPAYTFIDQPDRPDPLEDEDDVLLMPGPQSSWSDAAAPVAPLAEGLAAQPGSAPGGYSGPAVFAATDGSVGFPSATPPLAPVAAPAAEPVAVAAPEPAAVAAVAQAAVQPPAQAVAPPLAPVAEQAVVGTPVEPSWPPVEPPVLLEDVVAGAVEPADSVAPGAQPVAQPVVVPLVAAQPEVPQPVAAQPARRPLHAGPPIPDPSLMTGQVPVRSLADRGPSDQGGTPPHGIPVGSSAPAAAPAPVAIAVEPVGETIVLGIPAQAGAPESAVPQAPVVVAPVVEQPVVAEPVAAEPVAQVAEVVEVPAAVVVVEAPADPVVPVVEVAPPAEPAVAEPAVAEPIAVEPVVTEPAVAVAEVTEVAPEPVAAAPAPAPAAPQAGHPRRISAFLAAPAPLGLPIVEPVAEPAAPTEPVVAVAEPVAAVAAALAIAPEPEAAPVAEPVAPEPVAPEPVAPEAVAPEPVAPEAVTPVTEPVAAPPEPTAAPEPQTVPAPAPEPQTVPAPAPETAAGTGVMPPAPAEPAAEPEAPALAEPPAAEPAAPRPPAAPAYDEAMREAVHQVIRERRDIRNGFRPDPVPHEVLLRVLEAAHTAPSVGYSQPWDFVVIRSSETRRKMHELATRQREAFADSLPKARAKQFKEIKIEAILDTPVNIVVTADRTRGGRHTLGRHTQPQMAPYSAALAVENLWLAARAEGLGVGWVSFFDEEEMIRELGLPEHLDVVAYLCVGYVDAFPDEPELQQQGWAKKRPLSWVVHEEQYGNRALPGEEPHSVLSETLRTIRPLDAKALGESWDRQKRMTKPAGSLGMLEIISAQLSGLSRKCPPPIPEPACVAIFAGDHGVHAQGVTPWPQEVTAQMVANFLAGGAVVNAFAAQVGAEVCVVDVGVAGDLPDAVQQGRTTGLLPRKVKPGTDDMTQGPAMSRAEALKALETGIETARDLVAAGNKILITGDMGIANTTAAAALVAVFSGTDPAEVTGRGTGIDDRTHAHKIDVVRRALELHQPDPTDPIGVLSAVGGLEHAAIAGFLLGAASLRTPVILDGLNAGAAALVAKAIAPEVLAACIAGHRSAEPGHQAALKKLGLRPLIDLDLRLGEGTGALLALPLVQSAARAMHDVATFDTAGVTEKA